MLVTFLNRQLFWIVSVNLKNTNTEGKRDHTLNLPGKKKHVSDNRNKLGILRVHPSTQRQCCRWAGWCRWQRVRPRWVRRARLRLTGHTSHSDQPLPHWGAETETVRDSQHSCNQTKCCVLYHRANHHLMMQPLLTGDSAVSFSDRELQDLLSCQEPTLGSLPVSELFLLATTGPGPDPRLSRLILGPADSEGTFSPPGPSGSLPESLLVRLPFRLSEEETWLIWPSRSSREDRGTFTVFLHFLSFFVVVFFSIQFNSKSNW